MTTIEKPSSIKEYLVNEFGFIDDQAIEPDGVFGYCEKLDRFYIFDESESILLLIDQRHCLTDPECWINDVERSYPIRHKNDLRFLCGQFEL